MEKEDKLEKFRDWIENKKGIKILKVNPSEFMNLEKTGFLISPLGCYLAFLSRQKTVSVFYFLLSSTSNYNSEVEGYVMNKDLISPDYKGDSYLLSKQQTKQFFRMIYFMHYGILFRYFRNPKNELEVSLKEYVSYAGDAADMATGSKDLND